jgi:hypothetical protein
MINNTRNNVILNIKKKLYIIYLQNIQYNILKK